MDIDAIGRQFGLDPQQTKAAFEALAPVVAAGMRRGSPAAGAGGGGLGDLLGALGGTDVTRYADDASAFDEPQSVDDGNAILGQIFGSKDVSRGVARELSATTGIGDSILKKLLPMVAAYIMAQVAKKAVSSGGLGDILGSVLGGGGGTPQPQSAPPPQGGGLGDILGDILGGQDNGGRAPGGAPGDILGDILGGGRGSSSASAADDLLSSVERALRGR
jgi:hypothetical protein